MWRGRGGVPGVRTDPALASVVADAGITGLQEIDKQAGWIEKTVSKTAEAGVRGYQQDLKVHKLFCVTGEFTER